MPISPAVNTRRFDINPGNVAARKIRITDLAVTPTTVTIYDFDQVTVVQTLSSPDYLLYPRIRQEWQPITALTFPWATTNAIYFLAGQVLEIVATQWGFPSIPADIKEATAKRVIFRYMTDEARSGTAFSEALAQVNVGAFFASAQAAVQNYARPVLA